MDMQETCGSTSARSICIPSEHMCVDIGVSSVNGLKEMASSAYEHAIKVRKPYTITKQRERWTEEEHEKFLEALKLYGRAWRQIEEHIGSKTAVQIRSHAQKFFSKVTHESPSDGSGSVKVIEIPPPRPKRKPTHPYPRKLDHSRSMKMRVLEQSEWTCVEIPSTLEQENRSPTSVLTAFRSDDVGSSLSNLPSGCTSPLSSMAGSNQAGMFLSADEDNRCHLPVASSEEETRSPSPGLASTEDNSAMDLNLGVEDQVPIEGDPSMKTHAMSLKLFGRTVLVTDFHKPYSSDEGSVQCTLPSRTTDIQSRDKSVDSDFLTQSAILQNTTSGDFSGAQDRSAWSSWHGGMPPVLFCLPPCEDSENATTGATAIPSPLWWALCNNLSVQYTNTQDMSSRQEPCFQQEGSRSGSNASSCRVVDSQSSGWPTSDPVPSSSLRHSANSAFSTFHTGISKPARGFMPYKRCVAEKAVPNLPTADIDGDGQPIKLCL